MDFIDMGWDGADWIHLTSIEAIGREFLKELRDS